MNQILQELGINNNKTQAHVPVWFIGKCTEIKSQVFYSKLNVFAQNYFWKIKTFQMRFLGISNELFN